MALLIAYAFLAIGVSFLCSMLEASLLSMPRSHVEVLLERGSSVGNLLEKMKEEIDRPLAAILTLNTIAHTVGAAGVGAQAAVVFGSGAVGIASAVMTLLILIVSEIIPKTLGAVYAKGLAPFTALTVRVMIWLCLPLIIPLEWINRLVGYERRKDFLSRTELAASIRLGREGGALERREYRIVSNLLALSNVRLAEVLTPRTVVFSLSQDATVDEVMEEHQPLQFNRIPVYSDAAENVTGYVPRFRIHEARTAGEGEKRLRDLSQTMPVMPEQASVADALEQMLNEQQHIALVVDEYGGMAGIVTLEDAMESLLGVEIVDESDAVADMQELARRRNAMLARRAGQARPRE